MQCNSEGEGESLNLPQVPARKVERGHRGSLHRFCQLPAVGVGAVKASQVRLVPSCWIALCSRPAHGAPERAARAYI